jgi:hypothetical protein
MIHCSSLVRNSPRAAGGQRAASEPRMAALRPRLVFSMVPGESTPSSVARNFTALTGSDRSRETSSYDELNFPGYNVWHFPISGTPSN